MSPLVSILMPFKNEQAFIAEAIRSVLEAGCDDIEILCIDDGSSDGTVEIIRGISDNRIRIIASRGAGISEALNTGLDAAAGQYIARCDGDDRYNAGRLDRQLRMLKEKPDCIAVCGAFQTIDRSAKLIAPQLGAKEPCDITAALKHGDGKTTLCTFLIRRDAVTRLRFRPWFETAEDSDFQYRLAELGAIWYDPEPVYQYRLHRESITHSQANNRRVFFGDAAVEFARQRATRGSDDLGDGNPPEPPEGGGTPGSVSTQISGQLLGNAWRAKREGKYLSAVRLGFRSCLVRPLSIGVWRSLAAIMLRRGNS